MRGRCERSFYVPSLWGALCLFARAVGDVYRLESGVACVDCVFAHSIQKWPLFGLVLRVEGIVLPLWSANFHGALYLLLIPGLLKCV